MSNSPESLAEQFVLVHQYPDKAYYRTSSSIYQVGFLGAVVLDLIFEGALELEDSHVMVASKTTQMGEAHARVLSAMDIQGQPRKAKYWMQKLLKPGREAAAIMKEAMVQKGVFRVEQRRFLFIPYTRTYLDKHELSEVLRKELRAVLFGNEPATVRTACLLSLMQVCRTLPAICENKTEKREARDRVKAMVASNPVVKGVQKVIQEMEAAIIATTVAISAATSAATN